MKTTEKMCTQKIQVGRNYGVDLLRMVAMNMIVLLHVLGTGGVLSSTTRFSSGYATGWLIEMASFGAVNIFAIITGFVSYGRKTKYSNLAQLFIQIIFYTVVCTSVFFVISPDKVTRQTVVYSLLPFKIGGYWYFSAYFCLFLFIPFINMLIERLNGKSAVKMLLLCFIAFSVLPTVLFQDIGGLRGGYSVSWLAVMYAAGACIRKFDFRLKHRHYFLYYILCVAASWTCKLLIEAVTQYLTGNAKYGNLFASYISPFIVLSSVFLFLFFRDLKLNKWAISIVRFFAPTTFGVYLLHMEPLIKETFIVDRFCGYAKMNVVMMSGCVILTGLTIWLLCSLIDRLRIVIFKLIRIPSLCVRLETPVRKALSKMLPLLSKISAAD